MTDYRVEIITFIHNPQYTYYKLFIKGACQFDAFEDEVLKNPRYKKQYINIISIMEFVSDERMLTEKKFRQIKNVGRDDVFEFKSRDLRIYVIKKKPDIYIVLGGFKNRQDSDIRLLRSRIKDIEI